MKRRSPSRRLLVPEVVQTSAMDCGPASLKCLLEGFGISISYGRLREACQTQVDGTSIDTMEIACQLGLDAEQVMLPPEHVLLDAAALPAIAVVRLPSGMTHFVVVWGLSAAWRRRVASAPQFHENHVLQSSLAFNLLMGRRWPPSAANLAAADATCRELGLGELLGRMPAGLMEMVGETGWQLSHGEKSRVYLARALLQGADVLLLDESFGALDPETLGASLRAVLARAPTVLVIAHP